MIGEGRKHQADPLVHQLDIESDLGEVPDILVQVQHRAPDLIRYFLGGDPEDLSGVRLSRRRDAAGRDRHAEIDIEPLGGDPVRVEVNVVRAPSELLHADSVLALPLRFPSEQPQLAAGEQVFFRLLLRGRHLESQDRRQAEVGEEPEKGLGPLRLADARHAEELERRERIDHHPFVVSPANLLPQSGLERGHRHLDALELWGLPDRERDLSETDRLPHRGDVLEWGAFVSHHIGNRVEDVDLLELGSHRLMVHPNLVRRLLERHIQDLLAASHPFDEELHR